MRTKTGLVALLSCLAVAMGGLTVEAAAAKTAPTKHARKSAKRKSKRCKILLVNGIHRCKGEHARKTVSSNSASPAPAAPVVNVTINNPAPAAPAPAPAAAPTPAPAGDDDNKPGEGPKDQNGDGKPGNGPKDQNGDGKPGNGPKPKKDHGHGHGHGDDDE